MNHASIHNEIVQWSLDVQKLSKVRDREKLCIRYNELKYEKDKR